MKKTLSLIIVFLSISFTAKAGVVFGKVSGMEGSTQIASENSAVEVFLNLKKERKIHWIVPLKVYTEDKNGKKVTTIVYKAAIPGPTLPMGQQIQKQNQDAKNFGVRPNATLKDQAEFMRVLKQYEAQKRKGANSN